MPLPLLIHNLQPIRDRLARRPADDDLSLPPQPAHLLQLPDVRHGDREAGRGFFGFETRAVGGAGGEGDGGDVDVGGDVDPAFTALVAALEVDGARGFRVVGFGQDAEVVLGVLGARGGAGLVDAELGPDARPGGAFEEAEDVLPVLVFFRFGLVARGLLFGGFLVGVFVDGVVDLFVGRVEGEVVAVDRGRFGGWRLIGSGGRWDGSFVCFADAEESDGELCVCGDAFEDGARTASARLSKNRGQIANIYFLISSSFCQCGNFLFSRSRPRQMSGSPKKPKPIPPVTIFMNMAEVVNSPMATAGTRIPANLSLGASCGKGGVGDRALQQTSAQHHRHLIFKSYFANLSHPSAISPITCMMGLIFNHIACSIGCFVLSW